MPDEIELRPTYVPARVLMPTLDEVGTPDMFEDPPELYGELAAEIVADLDDESERSDSADQFSYPEDQTGAIS